MKSIRKASGVVVLALMILFIVTLAPGKELDRKDADPPRSLVEATEDLISAANQYRASVEVLIPIYEDALTSATEALAKRRELHAAGLISRVELEAGELAVTRAQTELDAARGKLIESDHLIAEARAEQANPSVRPSPGNTAGGRYVATSAIMRYTGSSGWSLSQVSKVQNFFSANFGRGLPITAFGQTGTHDRMGFAHHNSIDVAVHPDSSEGKALIAYLRGNGIPFIAFRSAVAGAATGAHIHIGYPSQRIR